MGVEGGGTYEIIYIKMERKRDLNVEGGTTGALHMIHGNLSKFHMFCTVIKK
jgi:hypothetical protein